MHKFNTFKSLCLLGIFVFAGFGAKAQFSHLETSYYVPCFSIPVSDFSESVSSAPMGRANIGKDAGFGFGAGLRASYRFDIGFGEVAPFGNIELIWNRVSSDMRDAYDNMDGKAPFYVNVPLFLGVNYRYQLTDIFTPFAEFALGPDIMFVSKETGTIPVLGNFENKYKTTAALAWQIGAGTYFNQRFSLGVHYYGLGSHNMKYKKDNNGSNNGSQKRNIGSLMFRIGFHF